MKRDSWAWVVLLGVVPLALKLAGAPVGEPVAEDFDFLRRALLTADRSLLDGGGSMSFWRPIAHQLYYLALGPMILAAPRWVAALHLALLAAGALLIYRALRPTWPGWAAAAAATFPLFAESTRTIVAWPTQFVDLGAYLFSALAIHERSRRRMIPALAALLAALLCKEVAVVTGVLLAWWPDRDAAPRARWRWALGTAALIGAWGAAYLWVRAHAGLALPHQIESNPAVLATPIAERVWWGTWNSLRAVLSLALRRGPADFAAGAAAVALIGGTIAVIARAPRARARFAEARGWIAWGVVWFAFASLTLAAIYPLWQPNRSQFGSVGLGIALVALCRAAGPAPVAALVAIRFMLLALAPPAIRIIASDPPDRGAFMDFERLSRLERLMSEMRAALHARYPTLPAGATLVQHNLPRASEYALGGSNALQVWYRDTTLRWSTFADFQAGRGEEPLAVVVFEPRAPGTISFAEPAAVRALLRAVALTEARRYDEALPLTARAESAMADTTGRLVRSSIAAVRGTALAATGQLAEAEAEATRSLALYPRNANAAFLLGVFRYSKGRLAEAESLLAISDVATPGDSLTRALLERVRAARRGAAR